MSTPIDELAEKAFCERDHKAFQQLCDVTNAIFFSRYRARIRKRSDTEDLIQEMWLRIVKKYDPNQPFLPFATVIMEKLWFDWLRRQDVYARGIAVLRTRFRYATTPSDGPETAELEQRLDRCVNQLSDEHKEIFRLNVRDELTYEAIAQRLGKTEPQVRGMGSRAKSSVLKCLEMSEILRAQTRIERT